MSIFTGNELFKTGSALYVQMMVVKLTIVVYTPAALSEQSIFLLLLLIWIFSQSKIIGDIIKHVLFL